MGGSAVSALIDRCAAALAYYLGIPLYDAYLAIFKVRAELAAGAE